jgi:hypothetical protein|tara:strand:- start:71 stop:367 length:297 start_codon:yes stop_codon:yes gene_type:complete
MAQYFNITGALTQELIAAGGGNKVSSIWLTNIHASDAVTVDLYLEKKLEGKFYITKSKSIANADYLVLEGVEFNNKSGEFGLYIKLNAADSAVDVTIR